jgi:uncharacterized protein YqjF (DUF2071 family)
LGTLIWMLAMLWEKLLFMHWSLPPAALEPLLPPRAKLDTFAGEAWLGIVPFLMSDVRPRFLPSLPGVSRFPELNVRTCVTVGDVPGVWFFSLEAASPVAVRLARKAFKLPYFDARMQVEVDRGEVRFRSRRTHRRAAPAMFGACYRPLPGNLTAEPALTRFLTERYRLYSADPRGKLYRADIRHRRWSLDPAEVRFAVFPVEMTRQLGLRLPAMPPLLHYAERLEVVAGLPYRV